MHYADPVVIDERTTPSKGLSQAYALRDVAYQLALKLGMKPGELSESDHERARSVTALVKAWECADDRIRIHRGKPLPGSLRPAPRAPRKTKRDRSADPFNGVTVYPPPGPGAEASVMREASACQTPVSDTSAPRTEASAPRTDPPAPPSAPSAAQ